MGYSYGHSRQPRRLLLEATSREPFGKALHASGGVEFGVGVTACLHSMHDSGGLVDSILFAHVAGKETCYLLKSFFALR